LVPNLCASLRPGTRNIGEKYAKFRAFAVEGSFARFHASAHLSCALELNPKPQVATVQAVVALAA
jgi:hypothetical protein